jgi:uncharacterized protein (DUF1778 family)
MNADTDESQPRRLTSDSEMGVADRGVLVLNAAQWEAFVTAMDAPPRLLPRLERLLREPGFFDSGPAW